MKSDNGESKPPKKPSPLSSESGTRSTPDDGDTGLSSPEEELLNLLRQGAEGNVDTEIKASLKYSSYTGIWPPPEILREQEEALPGSGERLLKWTERQTSRRQALEKIQVKGMERRMNRAQWFGGVVGVGSLISGPLTAIFMDSWAGAFCGIAIVAIGVGGPTAGRVIARALSDRINNKNDS